MPSSLPLLCTCAKSAPGIKQEAAMSDSPQHVGRAKEQSRSAVHRQYRAIGEARRHGDAGSVIRANAEAMRAIAAYRQAFNDRLEAR
jgi:hypothetical protein